MKLRRLLTLTALASACGVSAAHDTWFEPLATEPGERLLALGTGSQFPRFESGIDAQYLARHGCDGTPGALQAVRNDDTTLVLRAPSAARSCWVQLQPFEIELAPDKIPVYLKEIGASTEMRQTWAAMQTRGLPWREQYTKNARIELGAPSAAPAPLTLDLVIEGAPAPVRQGAPLSLRLLRNGEPLAGLALELRSEHTPLGLWQRSDAQGRVRFTPPLAGRWVVRGTDLRLSTSAPDTWESQFVTLAFDVQAAPAR